MPPARKSGRTVSRAIASPTKTDGYDFSQLNNEEGEAFQQSVAMLRKAANIKEDDYNSLPPVSKDNTVGTTWGCIAKFARGMVLEFPKGLGQGIQSTTIDIAAIEIPDRAEETYESYVKCIQNIIAFWFTPIKKDVADSEEESESDKDSGEDAAKKNRNGKKRKADMSIDPLMPAHEYQRH